MNKMTIKDIASSHIISLDEKETVAAALKTMTAERIHNIVLTAEDATYSVIGITDILQSVSTGNAENIPLASLPKKPLKTVYEDTGIAEASRALVEGDEILGVVDRDENLCAIATLKEISLKAMHLSGNTSTRELRRTRAEELLRNIIKETVASTGEDFFRQLVRQLGETLQMRYVLVGELQKDNSHVTTRALWNSDSYADNFTYALEGTPCENVVGKQACSYTKDVQSLFPKDYALVDMQAESYIGSPIFGSSGKPLGVLAVLDDKALDEEEVEIATSILSVFANRAAAELERIQTEQILEQSEQLYKGLFNNASSGIVMLGADRKILKANRAFQEFIGYSEEELTRLTPFDITYSDDIPDSEKVLLKQPQNEPERSYIEKRFICKNGDVKWASLSTNIFRDANGEFLYSQAIINDITKRKEAEAAFKQAHDELEHRIQLEIDKRLTNEKIMLQQSKFAAMGEMVSMIAHQWRQPLSAMASALGVLGLKRELGTLDDTILTKAIKDMNDYIQYMSKTIDDFRNFYKPEAELQSQQLSETMETSLGIIRANLAYNEISVKTDYAALTPIECYHNELMQVFLSILKNAQDALLENAVQKPFIAISITQSEEGIQRLCIHDNAGGIPENVIGRIFDPYFSTKAQLNGTGLGLYMAKIIVEEHCNGRLTVQNRDKGAEFIIELPE